MGIHEFNQLIDKFREGHCSLEEMKQLENQLQNENKVKKWMIDSLEQHRSPQNENINYDELFIKIKQQISKSSKQTKENAFIAPATILKWAAIFVLVFLTGAMFSYFIFNETSSTTKNTYSEIVAPYGSKTEMILPDGSKVWMNAGSKLKYPNDFNKSNRDVILEGEAFFKVEKNKNLPFIVDAYGLDIKVVGTTFNIKAYESENTITTILVEGKVMLESDKYQFEKEVLLNPSQKAVFSRRNKQLAITDLEDVYSEISWKDNQMIIKGEKLSDIAVKLERRYNVAIRFGSNDVKNYKFSGTLKDETIQQVLDVIKITAPIDYRMNGKDITLTTNTATINSYRKFSSKRIIINKRTTYMK